MTRPGWNNLKQEVVLWLTFVCAAAVNIGTIGAIDIGLERRRHGVSDGTMEFLDIVGVVLLGITLLGLRVRSRTNVGTKSVVACGLLPGLLIAMYMLYEAFG